jgi:hypothetical protein
MCIRNRRKRIKWAVVSVLIVLLVSLLSSCCLETSLQDFLEYNDEYNYYILEFDSSEKLYVWFEQKASLRVYNDCYMIVNDIVLPTIISLDSDDVHLMLRCKEYEPENLKYEDIAFFVGDFEWLSDKRSGAMEIDLAWAPEKNDKWNNMLELEDSLGYIKKVTKEEWRQWMKDHSLDPDLYVK